MARSGGKFIFYCIHISIRFHSRFPHQQIIRFRVALKVINIHNPHPHGIVKCNWVCVCVRAPRCVSVDVWVSFRPTSVRTDMILFPLFFFIVRSAHSMRQNNKCMNDGPSRELITNLTDTRSSLTLTLPNYSHTPNARTHTHCPSPSDWHFVGHDNRRHRARCRRLSRNVDKTFSLRFFVVFRFVPFVHSIHFSLMLHRCHTSN